MDTSRYLLIFIVMSILVFNVAKATEFISTNYQVLDPVQFPGGFSSSANFRLFNAIAQISIGTSTSGTYEVRSGFLYFPAPTPAPSPAPSPTPTPTPAPPPSGGTIPGLVQIFFPSFPILGIPLPSPLPVEIQKCPDPSFTPGDFNCDGTVDLADLSIFFYLSAYSPEENPADLNKNASIGLGDVSVMFYYWTESKVFSLAKSVGLVYEPPVAETPQEGGAAYAKTPPRPVVGYQKENGVERLSAEAFGVFEYIGILVVKAVDIVINLVSRLLSFF